jgi:hypothetical protein
MGAIQAKLAIGKPGDEYEQAADRAAEQVMRMPAPQARRACACGGGCPRCQPAQPGQVAEQLRMKPLQLGKPSQAAVPPVVDEVLASPGTPLAPASRTFMESRFGYDFSEVRVHADARAAESARAVKALAYTAGSNVVFGAGQYQPQTRPGQQLLAHELAHVVQQGAPGCLPAGVLQRYAHEDCTEVDLATYIWPADHIAKRKVDAAISAVSASPASGATRALFAKYFMTPSPDVAAIAQVLREVQSAFSGNAYTYECENDCDQATNAYSGRGWDIHLCMNNLRGRANACIARTIIHEFSHKYAGTGHGWWFGTAHCYSGCDTAGCPSTLSPKDALGNAYSFAGFAHEV